MSAEKSNFRKKIFSKSENEDESNNVINASNEKYSKYFKAGAVLLFTISILISLALISYTQKDEINAIGKISEYSGLVTGDESMQIKAETTHNWLGLLGAKLAYHLYNSTVGYIIIVLPYFLAVFSKDLFKYYEVKRENWKRFGIFILTSMLFAAFMGSINVSEVVGDISKEWYGNIGYFLSTFSSEYIGSFGSMLFYLAAIIITILLGTNINIEPLLNYFVNTAEKSSDKLKDTIKTSSQDLKSKIEEKYENIKESKKNEDKNESDEIIINSEQDYSISNQENYDKIVESFEEDIISDNLTPNNNLKIEVKRKEIENDRKKAFDLFVADDSDSIVEIQKKEIIEEPKVAPKLNITELNIGYKENSPKVRFSDEDEEAINEDIESEDVELENNYNMVEDNKSNQPSLFSSKIDDLLSDLKSNGNSKIDNFIDSEQTNKVESLLTENKINLESKLNSTSERKLVLDVEINNHDNEELDNPLSVLIHDEKINYTSPGIDLLDNRKFSESVDDDELKVNAKILQEKLETFKIYIENLQITPGPVVTQYAFTPAAGIKISRIESLQDDLAMALKAKGIRIIAPIPGKGSVGIEIPNQNPSLVTFSSVINTKKFYDNEMELPIALGKNISGEVVISDLAKMPHLLIAGTTGSGKSVGVNTIINSLLYKKSPNQLKFAVIDPKKVELPQYAALKNHFLAISPDIKTPIVTDPSEAIVLLKSAVVEMEQRYSILASAGQRNIKDYNAKVREGKYKDYTDIIHRELPYIVVIVDEFADLILTAGKDVEEPIVRLAQMARAVGIHMIIATQRPSVDVITGIIKANFPSRIAFQVSSKVDSRTILDTSGAETLLGNGDMLFLPSGKPKPERVQNAYISTDEVENICDFIGSQKGYSQPYFFPSIQEDQESGLIAKEDRDPLFEDAARLIIATQQGSVSMLQRRLKIGYARAGRIIDELADAGVVGPFDGSKARLVLFESESDLESIL